MYKDEAEELLTDFAQYLDEFMLPKAVGSIISSLNNPPSPKPKHPWEMIGDYLREAAVLVLALVPIDLLIPMLVKGEKPNPKWIWITLLVSFLLLGLGIFAERSRE
jgi:hypothetical protein